MCADAMAFMNLVTRQGLTPEQVFEKAAEAGFDCNANQEQYISVHFLKKVE
jgi:hypothetical protein